MGFLANVFRRIEIPGFLVFLLLLHNSLQSIHFSVDLVTKLSNNWIPTLIKEVSVNHENVIVSPYGLMSTLGMIFEAADDKTREEISFALSITPEEVPSLRKGFKAYCDLFLKYSSDSEAAGSFNAVYMRASFKLNPNYKEILEKYYCANITESLSNQDSEGLLEFSSITGVMSHWKDYEKLSVYTFLSHKPMTTFKKRDGSTLEVPMIPLVGVFKAGRWENSNVVLLPLQAKLVDFLLIVPDDTEKVDSVIKKLVEFTLSVLVQSLQKQEVEVFIPQTAVVNRSFNLTSAIMRQGIQRLFEKNQTNLKHAASPNSDNVIRLARLDQNAFFSTSFVAVNSVSGISSISSIKRRKRDTKALHVDRPFLYFILQKDTQMVLLAG